MKLCSLTVLLAAALALPLTALAQSTYGRRCTIATLHGDYAFRVSGELLPPGGGPVARDGVAMTRFDGRGGLTQVDFVMSAGTPMAGQEDPLTGFHTDEGGSYIVYPDCTGRAEIDIPPDGSGAKINLMFVLSDNGRVIHTIVSQLLPPGSDTPIPASIHSDGERL